MTDQQQWQADREQERRQHSADFHAAHPEFRNPVPTEQWPALLSGLPAPIAQAFTPLIATTKESL